MTLKASQVVYCDCGVATGRQEGWTNLGVGTDREWWVHSACHRPGKKWMEGADPGMLNFFKGGPMDGSAYETQTLLDAAAGSLPVTEYKWTPEVVTSSTTGASARVWLHTSLANDASSVAVVPPADDARSDDGSSVIGNDVTGGHSMAKKEVNLEERRKALKLSRGQVAAQSGLTQAKVYRIEKAGGRTTEEETAQVAAALDALEAAASADPA
jgi:hypothetical protein